MKLDDRLAALAMIATGCVCLVALVVTVCVMAARGELEAVALVGIVTSLMNWLAPSPLTKLRPPAGVHVDQAETVDARDTPYAP